MMQLPVNPPEAPKLSAADEQRLDELQRIAKAARLLEVDTEEWSEWFEVREAATRLAYLVGREVEQFRSIINE